MKKKDELKKEFVALHQAWLEAYTAWLQLDSVGKQMYPMPKEPHFIEGKVYL